MVTGDDNFMFKGQGLKKLIEFCVLFFSGHSGKVTCVDKDIPRWEISSL